MIIKRNHIIGLLILLFLIAHTIPLYNRFSYKIVTLLNYSLILPVVLLSTLNLNAWKNPGKSFFYLGIIFLSFILFVFGFSGSISALLLCACAPFFIFNKINSYQDLIQVLDLPIKLGSIVLIILGLFLYSILKSQLLELYFLGEYFVIASINYVSLLFYNFSLLYVLIYFVKNNHAEKTSKFDFILGIVLIGLSIFFSSIYLTRSTFMVSIVLLILFLKKYAKPVIIISLIAIVLNGSILLKVLTLFIGSDDISAVAGDEKRIDSMLDLISHTTSFGFDFSNHMSYSSLLNLLFCLFPLSLFFLTDSFKAIYSTLKINKFYMILFGLGCFIVVYQMDFLSIFVFFLLIEVILFEGSNINRI